ncbi:hypothetical protein P280DRAFT_450947 [Massarina eburnea CBS 473.64]|uniref:Uncharacterized protein n=1 Tax=Massarina eburnea CBS 473.64 TaxID=1395130 RepID=A0A6A6S4D7_9PLEO|nr:hypothetical protein P280DRAFT_450947 [Massarina eburnea CBS 473.64]
MVSIIYKIIPIQYNSQCISYPEWVTLLTICLCPLFAHIVSGTSPISYLSPTRPKWYDRICHYNPTSIIWRYAAITDRRVRAICWSRNDLAASNAIFWTAKGWDGSEEMVLAASPYCLFAPETTHSRILSIPTLETVITTLQGLSALYTLLGWLIGFTPDTPLVFMGVDTVFFPLAILGLLRLSAASWLTDEYLYSSEYTGIANNILDANATESPIISTESNNNLDPFLTTLPRQGARFKSPRNSWPSRIVRTVYLLLLGCFWAICLLFLAPSLRFAGVSSSSTYTDWKTATSFLVGVFCFFILTISIVLYTFYFFRGQTTTTIIPCSSKLWYKIYTMSLFSFMLALLGVACMETNRGPKGEYSSRMALGYQDCRSMVYLMETSPDTPSSGLTSSLGDNMTTLIGNIRYDTAVPNVTGKVASGNSTDIGREFWMYDFTGYCVGHITNIDEEI